MCIPAKTECRLPFNQPARPQNQNNHALKNHSEFSSGKGWEGIKTKEDVAQHATHSTLPTKVFGQFINKSNHNRYPSHSKGK